MAVFTKINKKELEDFIDTYNIGRLDKFIEIVEGIENTNYKIICNGIPYILTIFEKRVQDEDLPFFINLKLYLNKKNFKCPLPIKNKKGFIINSIKNKKGVIISFIEGKKIDNAENKECYEIGKVVGNLHKLTKDFKERRENSLNIFELKKIFNICVNSNFSNFQGIFNQLKEEIHYLEKILPKNLPCGIIHADLFKDNVFFDHNKVSGVIDFYFSCYDSLIYDIAIVINDWCFTNNGNDFNYDFSKSILDGYNQSRKLSETEINSFNVILRLAAVRILVTRLHDYIFHPNDAVLVKKDPYQYLNILTWHQKNRVY